MVGSIHLLAWLVWSIHLQPAALGDTISRTRSQSHSVANQRASSWARHTSHTSKCSCRKSSATEAGFPLAPGGKKAPAQLAVTSAKPAVPTWMVPHFACGSAAAGTAMEVLEELGFMGTAMEVLEGAAAGAAAGVAAAGSVDKGAQGVESAEDGAMDGAGGAVGSGGEQALFEIVVISEMSCCWPSSRRTSAALRKPEVGGVLLATESGAA